MKQGKNWVFLLGLIVISCGQSDRLTDVDSVERAILADVAVTDEGGDVDSLLEVSYSTPAAIEASFVNASVSSETTGSTEAAGAEGAEARKRPFLPILKSCKADAQLLCPKKQGGETQESKKKERGFSPRRAKVRRLIGCLKKNVDKITSEECKSKVEVLPEKPKQRQRKNDSSGKRVGKSPLGKCVEDVRLLCPANVPTQSETGEFSRTERKERVQEAISCLKSQLENVSDSCQTQLQSVAI